MTFRQAVIANPMEIRDAMPHARKRLDNPKTDYNTFTRRREAQYGSQYMKGRVIPLFPLHDAVPNLVLRLAEDISELVGAPMKQGLINGYAKGRGIGPLGPYRPAGVWGLGLYHQPASGRGAAVQASHIWRMPSLVASPQFVCHGRRGTA